MVQKSPDVVHALPDDLADLAAEFDSDDISALAVMSQQAAAAGASRIAQQVSKDTFLPEILWIYNFIGLANTICDDPAWSCPLLA